MGKLTTLNTKLLLAAIAAVAALGAVAVVAITPSPSATSVQRQSAPPERLPEAGLRMWDVSKPAPVAVFADQDGKMVGLDRFRGKVAVVNFWATWCEPCKQEMPSLLRLQQQLGTDKVSVVAVSGDREGKAAVDPYVAENKLTGLTFLYDPMLVQARSLDVRGLPTTLVLGRDGRELGRAEGALQWDSKAIAGAIAGAAQGPGASAAP